MKSFAKFMAEKKLDPVNKNALKGKHSDRKDGDIDNDGDVDSSDEYLHKRRKAITKATTNESEKKTLKSENCDTCESCDGEGCKECSKNEAATKCPKCDGEGCEHCDFTGTHQIDEFIGKAIGGAVKMIAKGARNAVVNKQGNIRGTQAAKADSAEAKASKQERKNRDRERIKNAAKRLKDAQAKAAENN